MDFDKYKSYLKNYLESKGYSNFNQNIKCFAHEDKNPSMHVYDDTVKCFSCGWAGDVFDCIGYFENISDRAEQYKFAEKLFIGGIYTTNKQGKKQEFQPDQDALNIVADYIRNNINKYQNEIQDFVLQREYEDELAEKFSRYLGYWEGTDKTDIPEDVLYKAGIPKKSWNNPGVIVRFKQGFKLHYIQDGKTEKRGSIKSHTFPYPNIKLDKKQIILVEGELDAIALQSEGIDNAIAIGGTNGLNDKDIYELLTFEEIILCMDADKGGKKADGRIPNINKNGDKIPSIPERLLDKNYQGIIKICELPENEDPDNLVKNNQLKIILQALYNAKIYELEDKDEGILENLLVSNDSNNIICNIENNSNNNNSESQSIDNDNSIQDDNFNQLIKDAINSQAQALFSDILNIELKNLDYRVVTESIDKRHNVKFYIQKPNECFFNETMSFIELARKILESVINKYVNKLKNDPESNISEAFYSNVGKALKKVRTKDFLNSTIHFFGRSEEIIKKEIQWNITPEALPFLDGILDFSNNELVHRQPYDNEYFNNPIQFNVNDIITAKPPEKFNDLLNKYFPDSDTQETAKYCFSQMIANVPAKTFQIWCSEFGNNGKNTLVDFFSWLLSKRAKLQTSSIIMREGDRSERRFGLVQLKGCTAGIFDESSETESLALNQIKKLTGLSDVQGEFKGQDQISFPQTWTLIILTNELPRFYPPNEIAFLNRMLILPFSAVFYSNEIDKQKRIQSGVLEKNLYLDRRKDIVLSELKQDGAGVIKLLIECYLFMKNNYNSDIPLSGECQRMKSKYVYDNDQMEQFFSECLTKVDSDFYMTNDQVKKIYLDFFGDYPKNNYIKKLADRYKLKQTVKSVLNESGSGYHSARVIMGIQPKLPGNEIQETIKYED